LVNTPSVDSQGLDNARNLTHSSRDACNSSRSRSISLCASSKDDESNLISWLLIAIAAALTASSGIPTADDEDDEEDLDSSKYIRPRGGFGDRGDNTPISFEGLGSLGGRPEVGSLTGFTAVG
jgi:hypothetical protein